MEQLPRSRFQLFTCSLLSLGLGAQSHSFTRKLFRLSNTLLIWIFLGLWSYFCWACPWSNDQAKFTTSSTRKNKKFCYPFKGMKWQHFSLSSSYYFSQTSIKYSCSKGNSIAFSFLLFLALGKSFKFKKCSWGSSHLSKGMQMYFSQTTFWVNLFQRLLVG